MLKLLKPNTPACCAARPRASAGAGLQCEMQVLGLVDPWSETFGTDYTLGCCRVLGARPAAEGRLIVRRQELPRFGARPSLDGGRASGQGAARPR